MQNLFDLLKSTEWAISAKNLVGYTYNVILTLYVMTTT